MLKTKALKRVAAFVLLLTAGVGAARAESPAGPTRVYIGTYTGPRSQGIYMLDLDPSTGALTPPRLAGRGVNPSWLTFSPNRKFLFACEEYGTPDGSSVAAYSISPDGSLMLLNERAMAGGPCYATVDATGRNLLAASYGSGHVEVFPIAADGQLGASTAKDQHGFANSTPPPHAHCIDADPANRFVLSCDAGLDKIYVYRFDAQRGALTANDPPFAVLPPHAAPRHLVFSKDGKFAYTIQEAASTVTVFSYDADRGTLQPEQTISTLPDGVSGKDLSTAELILHPSGKLLYGSNRGHDSIVGYRVDEQTGRLSLIGQTPTNGKTPRGFGIDPSGRWLIAGHQNSDNLVEFEIDPRAGTLKPLGVVSPIGGPVCVKFFQPAP